MSTQDLHRTAPPLPEQPSLPEKSLGEGGNEAHLDHQPDRGLKHHQRIVRRSPVRLNR